MSIRAHVKVKDTQHLWTLIFSYSLSLFKERWYISRAELPACERQAA